MTREEMIIDFYSEGTIPIILKFLEEIRRKIYEYRNNSRMGRD